MHTPLLPAAHGATINFINIIITKMDILKETINQPYEGPQFIHAVTKVTAQ